MAVELRCPECRTKLRLKETPDAGTEIECPKCGHGFPAPEADDGPKALPDEFRKNKSGKPDKPEAADAPAEPKKSAGKKAPRKRRAIKHKTNPKLLIAVVVAGLLVLGSIVTALVWYMGRKSVAVEMLGYLPDDADSAVGVNLGHTQKYPEVFKTVEPVYANAGFKKAADIVGQAVGVEGRDWLDYAVTGTSKSGGTTIVLRSKKAFDQGVLAKLPGAREASGDGGKFYTVGLDVPGLGSARAFAPTNRLVVFCSGSVAPGTFGNMMRANKDNAKAFPERMGALGKRMTKGTLWSIELFDVAPKATEAPAADDSGQAYTRLQNDLMGGTQGKGFKASLGSRAVRIELAMTCRDPEAASGQSKKYNASAWAKGDDDEPPREWKAIRSQIGEQKVARELYANFAFTSSGNVFVVKTECDTRVLMTSLASLLGKISGQQSNQGGPPLGPPPGMSGPPKQ